ncbi:MAG: 1-acyl-sn-glycerol-3-phosphate acyltransferase [Polaribacter sp.]|jgi:1-acyl-sn-glycerol-3-phosphate acyltransferase
MLSKFLPKTLVGSISFIIHVINTLFWVIPIFAFAIVKFALPFSQVKFFCDRLLNASASNWISINALTLKLASPIDWQIELPENLSTKEWYLVMANHQSWVDILVLQKVLNRKVPFLKFFLKQELLWVPVLGLAWWALDFPFMKRFSKTYIKKNPHKKGQDFETTRKACEKFKSIPISIMNFPEGTRFTTDKHDNQPPKFTNLLKPKAGGVGYVLTFMGNEIKQVLDVTIDYPKHPSPSFWDFMTGELNYIHVKAKLIEIPEEVQGSYIESSENRRKVQRWVNGMWEEKDEQLDRWRSKE